MTKEEFIKKAIEKHGDKYDYSQVEYKNNKTSVIIICKDCGTLFTPRPDNFLHGTGCPKCGRKQANLKMCDSLESFITKAISKHGDKYDYSLVEYVKSNVKVRIKCNKCGSIFEQTPAMHLSGNGCSVCNPPHKKLTHEEFVERLSNTHPNLEVLTQYNGKDNKITVRCKIHDYTYETTPHRLVQGMNCKYCYNDKRGETLRNDVNTIIANIKSVHGNKYEYPNIENEYKSNKSKITIICPIHGEFKQTYNKHVNRAQCCPYCSESHNERYIDKLLIESGIEYKREQTFSWLGRQSVDFYMPNNNTAFEIQGEFHFNSMIIKGKIVDCRSQINRDIKKARLCKNNNIRLIYLIPTNLIPKIKHIDIYNKSNVIEITNKGEFLHNNAYIGRSMQDLMQFVESDESNKDKNRVDERIGRINKILL